MKWIKLADQKPEKAGYYLTHITTDLGYRPEVSYWTGDAFEHFKLYITHWLEIPEISIHDDIDDDFKEFKSAVHHWENDCIDTDLMMVHVIDFLQKKFKETK